MSDWPFEFRAYGTPVSKGSGFVVVRGRAVPQHSAKIKKWEKILRAAWQSADPPGEIDAPAEVYIRFYVRRPKRPRFSLPATQPDIDKLTRCVLDAIQRKKDDIGLLRDDSRVVSLGVELFYASDDEPEGCKVIVGPLE